MTTVHCVVFDLDGTLIDSESLCNQAFLDLLPELNEPTASLVKRYRGKKLATIIADIELRIGITLPPDFEARYRRRVEELFDGGLRPIVGVHEMLQVITNPRCIASSAPRQKILKALQLTGLTAHFGNRIFSSYEVQAWKPDPGLFLHAAASMGFEPKHCVVVEDSEVGVQAALAAGMQVLRYAPDCAQDAALACRSFSRMEELPGLLGSLANV